MKLVKDWFKRNLGDPQVVVLILLLLAGFVLIAFLGGFLIPVLASLVIAYLLESVVLFLQRSRMPRYPAVMLVYFTFLALLGFSIFGLGPLLFQQAQQALTDVPSMVGKVGGGLRDYLEERLPEQFKGAEFSSFLEGLQNELVTETGNIGRTLLAFSWSSVQGLVVVFVYLILMPILVFFMLKDKDLILDWFQRFVPKERRLAAEVWRDVDLQIGNYVRGKAWEILIVGGATHLTFTFLGLRYRMLLALLVGFSVVVPYVGATVVTFPVALVAYAQFGPSPEFLWVVVAYLIIQALDGNVLVPLLFSEVVHLHPIAIISAVLVFGGVWGFWGIFFAIPLATLVQAVIKAWPRSSQDRRRPPKPPRTRPSEAETFAG